MKPCKSVTFCLVVLSLAVTGYCDGVYALDASSDRSVSDQPLISDYTLPSELFLCAELVPLQNPRVHESLDRELVIAAMNRAQVIMWLKRAGRYFPYIEKKLDAMGMPDDLKYLAVAESALIDYARSNAGATGMWQFMAHTGKSNGLRRSSGIDERRNFELSTAAALRHLKDLKDDLGKWNLAMAAYNCGITCVKKAINKQKVWDYYRLNLPRETERYVFRIAAIKLVMQDPARYGYHLPPERAYTPIPVDRIDVRLAAPVHMTDLAKALDTDYKVIKELNPQFLGYYMARGHHTIRVPGGKGKQAKNALASLSKRSPKNKAGKTARSYTVRTGDSLSKISQKTGVPMSRIKSLNNIKGSIIHKGQKLRLE